MISFLARNAWMSSLSSLPPLIIYTPCPRRPTSCSTLHSHSLVSCSLDIRTGRINIPPLPRNNTGAVTRPQTLFPSLPPHLPFSLPPSTSRSPHLVSSHIDDNHLDSCPARPICGSILLGHRACVTGQPYAHTAVLPFITSTSPSQSHFRITTKEFPPVSDSQHADSTPHDHLVSVYIGLLTSSRL